MKILSIIINVTTINKHEYGMQVDLNVLMIKPSQREVESHGGRGERTINDLQYCPPLVEPLNCSHSHPKQHDELLKI